MRLSMGMGLYDWIQRVAGSVGPPLSTLLDGLVSYWPLNEQSGTRADVVGGNDLTDNNTVGAVNRGPLGTVARFVQSNNEFLSKTALTIADTQAYTITFWLRDRSTNSQRVPILLENVFFYNEASGLYFYGSSAGVVTGSGTAMSWTDDSWHFVVIQQSGTTSQVSVDGKAFLTKTGNTPPANGSYNLQFGQAFGGGYAIDGDKAIAGLWNSALDVATITSLFNAGHGKKYADLTTAEKVGLVSYWDLDEVSGTRYDSHGTNHLTDNNTVGSVNTGPLGTVAKFTAANNESLSGSAICGADAAVSIVVWYYVPNTTTRYSVIDSGGDGNFHIRILGGSAGSADMITHGFAKICQLINAANPGVGWHMYAGYHDPINDLTGISVDGGAFSTLATGGPNGTPASFLIGNRTGNIEPNDSNVEAVGTWSKVITQAECIALFNSGNGKKYADLTAAEKVGLVSYWNLDEASGTRADSHGANDLTDNNTVGSVINAGEAMDGAAAKFIGDNSESLTRALLDLGGTKWTSSFWWKPSITPNATRLWSLVSAWADKCIVLRQFAHPTVVYGDIVFGYGTGYLTAPVQFYPTPNEWYLVIIEGNDTSLTVTLNGDIWASATAPSPPSWTAGAFGINYSDGGVTVNATIDEIAIWDRVLTADERTELFNLGRGKYYDFS